MISSHLVCSPITASGQGLTASVAISSLGEGLWTQIPFWYPTGNDTQPRIQAQVVGT